MNPRISIIYPIFQIISSQGKIIPNIPLPENYEDLVKRFYNQGRNKIIIEYTKDLEELLNNLEKTWAGIDIRLNWHESEGLRNISVGTHGGLDLETRGIPHFVEHNLGWTNGFIATTIATKYVSELLKSEQI